MEDTIVQFSTAKLLKDKGFKELVNHYYLSNSEIREQKVHISYGNDGDFYVEQDEFLDNFNDNFRETISGNRCFGCNPTIYLERFSAPTLSLAQKWLREVHNLHINIKHRPHSQTYCFNITGAYQDANDGEWYSALFSKYETYEQCLESAIQESLKLIK